MRRGGCGGLGRRWGVGVAWEPSLGLGRWKVLKAAGWC